jgi:hypothetical protein
MALNVIRKSPIFLGHVTKYALRNRPYEALKRGLARWQATFIPLGLERIRKNWGWARPASASKTNKNLSVLDFFSKHLILFRQDSLCITR